MWVETIDNINNMTQIINNMTQTTEEIIPHAMDKRESITQREQSRNKTFRNERVNEVS